VLVAGIAAALSLSLAGGHVVAQTPPRVTVQAGDTLSDIALRYYGDAAEAGRIAAANKLINPDLLLAGTALTMPATAVGSSTPTASAAASAATPPRRVTVGVGDTLSAIALRVYGSADYAAALAAANGITQMDLIRTGQELSLPASLTTPSGRGAAVGGTASGTVAGKRICIDPGHGGADPGASFLFESGTVLRESDVTLDISLALAQRLRAQGATVIMTRERDLTLDLSDRAFRCNSAGAALTVSVHLNGVDNAAINGSLALYGKPVDRTPADIFAGVLQSGLFGGRRADATAFGSRSFDGRVLLYTTMPAVIVEPSFITNPIDARALATPTTDPASRRAQIVRELERGITAYMR